MGAVAFLKNIVGLDRRGPAIAPAAFDHAKAQEYEWRNNAVVIRDHFPEVYSAVQADLASGGLWYRAEHQFFEGDEVLYNAFVARVRDRKCLEVGSGPFGFLPPLSWIKNRIVIEPLAAKYRDAQLQQLGKTFFTDDLKVYATNAEDLQTELIAAIDGAIICRNALDHCEDALTILYNLSRYATAGCYFLLWTDTWHLDGVDDGHHNITKSPEVLNALLSGLGFDVIKNVKPVRESGYIEYGCVALKR
jgi:hypothetical protein